MSLLDRLFPSRGAVAEARKAELRGDLVRAIELWSEADDPGQVARVMLLRGDSETDARLRLQHYVQAATTAPDGSDIQRQARVKRASLRLALATDASVSATTRRELIEAAKEFEELGEADRAAEAYGLLKDTEGQARALVQGGQVEQLETLLATEQDKTDEERHRAKAHAEVETLLSTGRRREALAAAERLAMEGSGDASARERVQSLRSRRLGAGVCRLLISGRPLHLLMGEEVVLGRAEGSLLIRSVALSRRHLAIVRGEGAFQVRDLETRNGTLLRGMRMVGPMPVGDGLELMLGGQVRVVLSPSSTPPDALDIQVGGERYLAPLGPLRLGVVGWRLERASDGWIELVTDEATPPYVNDLVMVSRTTLLVGDRIAPSRGGQAALEVLGAD
jgi:hypothetical protein